MNKKITQRVRKGILLNAIQNWEAPKPTLGLTPINKRNFKIWRLVLHDAAEELSLIVDRLRTRTTPHDEREEGDFERSFQRDSTDTKAATPLCDNPLCSTRPPFFTQPAVQQLRQPSRITNSISTTTDNNIL